MDSPNIVEIADIGDDPEGDKYAFLNSLYYIGYAPFSEYCHVNLLLSY
jgi:hypothetical protein